ncbi:MAG: hypothetical protein J6M60_02850 [Clostridia bacterium]|nr:hypothetical protein [Clostridia bacterium]
METEYTKDVDTKIKEIKDQDKQEKKEEKQECLTIPEWIPVRDVDEGDWDF